MEQERERNTENFMVKIARFIVDKRKAFYLIFMAAVVFCHRYVEERERGLSAREADIAALSKAIVEISSSSLTTISGLVALMLMQLRIGFDMGVVLSKGIICSLLTVFLLMPGLIMLFAKGMDRTKHKNFVPEITMFGKAVVKLRFVLPAVFVVILMAAIFFPGAVNTSFPPIPSTPTTSRII